MRGIGQREEVAETMDLRGSDGVEELLASGNKVGLKRKMLENE
jgi:hypothetical protein